MFQLREGGALPVAFVVAVRAVAAECGLLAVAVRAVAAECGLLLFAGLRIPKGSQQEDRNLSFRSLCPVYTVVFYRDS